MQNKTSLSIDKILSSINNSSIKFFGEDNNDLYEPLLLGNHFVMHELIKYHYRSFLSLHKDIDLDLSHYTSLQSEGFANIQISDTDTETLYKLS